MTNKNQLSVFQGQGDEEIRRLFDMFVILFKYLSGVTYVARREGKLVGVVRMLLLPHCLMPLPESEAAQKLELLMKQNSRTPFHVSTSGCRCGYGIILRNPTDILVPAQYYLMYKGKALGLNF